MPAPACHWGVWNTRQPVLREATMSGWPPLASVGRLRVIDEHSSESGVGD